MDAPYRKHPRLSEYDYASAGVYFVTVCTQGKKHLLCRIDPPAVGRGLAPAVVRLSKAGLIVKQELFALEQRFENLTVDKYVIMPNHVHVILILDGSAGASPRPTVSDIICAWKSLSSLRCKRNGIKEKLWQTSFHDHIIRDENDYLARWRYIDSNPAKWAEDEYYQTTSRTK